MATKKKAKPKTYKGKSTKPGGGGDFAMMVDSMMKGRGMSKSRAQAVAAAMGRKKYGKKRFQKMAVTGRKRAAKKRKGK